MSNQTITRDNLKEIHNIACARWKTKLEGYAKRNPFDNDISFSQSEVDEMLKSSDAAQIKVLRKFFSIPKDIRDKVKSFLDACNILNIDPKSVYHSSDSPMDAAFKKLKIIIKALNEGWWPDFENESQYKYWNYFKIKGGFSPWVTNCHATTTDVPSALLLKSDDLAVHVVEIALEEYRILYTSKD
jgi:hypothetical protein